MTATLLPNAKQQFFDTNGRPLAGGKVYFYVPNTSTLKNTWQDAGETVLNTNPVVLDANGQAIIYGDGQYRQVVNDVHGNLIWDRLTDSPALNSEFQALSSGLSASTGSSLIGFIQSGVGAVAETVQDSLRERVSALQFMSSAQRIDVLSGAGTLDVSGAVQLAINYGGDNAIIEYPAGNYKFAASVVPRPGQEHLSRGATITVASNIYAFSRTTDGFPGRISFKRFKFVGTGSTGRAISMTNNTPMVSIEECYANGFNEAFVLDGSYSSVIARNHITGNNFGIVLLNESHATALDDNFIDANTYAGVCINGDPVNGARGTNPMHNITIKAGAYQNTQFGIWAENCYELEVLNPYHEGNTKADLRLGVADAGAYNRACYNFTVENWQSSSACAMGKNIIIEHAVNGNMSGLAFNAGTSTTAAVLSADGFSDLINIDYHRVQTAAFSSGIPFTLPSGRVKVSHNGRSTIPFTMKAISFGNLDQVLGNLWATFTGGGRPLIQLESLNSGSDIAIKANDIERHYNGAGTEQFNIDHLNSRVNTAYIVQPMVDNTTALGGPSNRWSVVYAGTGAINTSDEREKQDIGPIDPAALRAVRKIGLKQFRFRDAAAERGSAARIHFGVIAQEVKAAFEAEGLDPFAFGILCYDEWDDQYDVDTGELIRAAGNRYGVRYDELWALKFAALEAQSI